MEPGQLRRWSWPHPTQSPVLARRVGLSFPVRLQSGPDESLGVSAGTGATHDCPRHGPAPGQGAPCRWPRGPGVGAWPRSPPGLAPRGQPALVSVPSIVLSFLHLASEILREEGGGRRQAGWAWSCPGHSGLCLYRGGLPGGCLGFCFPRQKRPRQGAWANLCQEPCNPAQAPRSWICPADGLWGARRPSRSPSCPQNPAICTSGGLGWGCQQQTLGCSGHADRHPWRFTQ